MKTNSINHTIWCLASAIQCMTHAKEDEEWVELAKDRIREAFYTIKHDEIKPCE